VRGRVGRTPPARRLLLLVIPLLLSGCSMFTASKGGSGAGDGTGTAAGDQWLIVAQGSATPSPVPSTSGARPTPSATGGFLPLPPATPRPTPSATCARDTPHFNKINALQVEPGTTSAKVRWYNVGGYNLVEFRVTAINQDLVVGTQRDVGTVTVKADNPCGYLTATLPNLSRKTSYVFSVDAVVVRRSGDGTHAATIFRSSVVDTK
jgi:hypothetical protein